MLWRHYRTNHPPSVEWCGGGVGGSMLWRHYRTYHPPSVEWCGVHTNGGELWWPCDVPGPHPYQGDDRDGGVYMHVGRGRRGIDGMGRR